MGKKLNMLFIGLGQQMLHQFPLNEYFLYTKIIHVSTFRKCHRTDLGILLGIFCFVLPLTGSGKELNLVRCGSLTCSGLSVILLLII